MMNDHGKSDQSVVPEKLPNKADNHAAEVVEERDWAKGNSAKRAKPLDTEPDGFAQCAGASRTSALSSSVDLRQEPDMGNLYVRIRAGGGE